MTGRLVAATIVLLRNRIMANPLSFGPWLPAFNAAFLQAAFFSGLVRLITDNYTNDTSQMGTL